MRPAALIGQSDKHGSGKTQKGMKVAEQKGRLQEFRDNLFNVLIATSVGEEGLDVGEVTAHRWGQLMAMTSFGLGHVLVPLEGVHGMVLEHLVMAPCTPTPMYPYAHVPPCSMAPCTPMQHGTMYPM